MKTNYILLLLIFIGFTACENDDLTFPSEDNQVALPELNTNGLDFSKYVSIGASFTAGVTDGGLFIASQENSFPNILSQQFANADGGAFTQPLMSDNTGGILVAGNVVGGYRLTFNSNIPGPQPLDDFLMELGAPVPPITTEAGINIGSDFNNFGIPSAKSFHFITPGYAAFNPFYARIASAQSATVLADAMSQNPTFFTLSEIGGNDALGYALSGGESDATAPNYDPLTDISTFDTAFNMLATELTSGGAKGVATNVPDIKYFPHFTTVPYNPVPLDAATAGALNQGYALYNGGLQQAFAALNGTGLFTAEELAKRTINFSEGEGNALVIIDETLTDLGAINPAFSGIPQYRQATIEDLFVLPLSSLIPQGYGTQIPLEDKWVLIPSEQTEINMAINAYNATIESTVSSNPNIVLADFNGFLEEASITGVQFDDFNLNTDLVFGGLVSLDGFHLTARGYALMANKFLEAMDKSIEEGGFGTNFIASGTVAKANDYPTNYSPTLQ